MWKRGRWLWELPLDKCANYKPCLKFLLLLGYLFSQGEESRYSLQGTFECLPCAEGCDVCVDNRPCIVSLNWVMRTIILILSCVIILFLPAIVFFTWKYGNVKASGLDFHLILILSSFASFFFFFLFKSLVLLWGIELTYGKRFEFLNFLAAMR